ncbi:electron transport complex protein RnfA [Paracholeplasma manati]|uniref:RnfABCDGE type electron transport complex subunit A n=1 Tax=Paracholeplasma manati TaxID=591373 RepID=A0ABT2Y4C1_9MOLU|nr:RnfABCDGE type electron transport complex subunit A [Paracholeplasma manati]MCV2231579.1 RnfABCDGE type electron transport complex subunit A [Paracholeplasma manati]MDG0889375.1 RnfABCDGE type electron transport complex subunit A [Paracholeplasma manati]
MTLEVFFVSLISSMLINNIIVIKFLGICSFLGVSKKMSNVWGMSAAVMFVMMISTAITYPLYFYVLDPLGVGYVDTIAFILVIAAVVQLVEMLLKKYVESLYRGLGVYLPLITTNCAVLGVAQTNITEAADYLDALTITFGTVLGYTLVIVAFSAIRIRLDSANVPKAFKGMPIALVVAGLMSLAFLGLQGLI